MMKIGIVDVYVHDQDRARHYYTSLFGLQVKDDAARHPHTKRRS